ncbi:hypothetical protein ACQ5SO_09450 [Rhodovulum sp. DZ06]|uniref:hypothetical protein n=1 Tax=Rhodovulum sp. DZ06 TaxID=3425126 RepID=UPI003D3391D1
MLMLLVKCLHLPDPDAGTGLYTLEPIRAGDVVWRFGSAAERPLPAATCAALGPAQRRAAEQVAPQDVHALALRHDAAPNLDFSRPMVGVALRDISEGEELTADLSQFALPGAAAA